MVFQSLKFLKLYCTTMAIQYGNLSNVFNQGGTEEGKFSHLQKKSNKWYIVSYSIACMDDIIETTQRVEVSVLQKIRHSLCEAGKLSPSNRWTEMEQDR